jgi:hypothetical protein
VFTPVFVTFRFYAMAFSGAKRKIVKGGKKMLQNTQKK